MSVTLLSNIALVILAYLVGSTPSALIIGKIFFKGKDIRTEGSGNLGTTNMLRVLGFKAALATALFDILIKGSLTTFTAILLMKNDITTITPLFVGFAAAIGHAKPIFANFRGGKCVATTVGILLPINPLLFLITCILIFIIFVISQMMSIASFLSLIIAFMYLIITDKYNLTQIIVVLIYYIFVLYLHKDNIKRIIKKEEKKVDLFIKFKKQI